MARVFDGSLSASASRRGFVRRLMCLSTLTLARWSVWTVLAGSLLAIARRRLTKHTKVLWVVPLFGGSLGSSLDHDDEIKVGEEMVNLCSDVPLRSARQEIVHSNQP